MNTLHENSSLTDWLDYLEQPQQNCIKLDLERITKVARILDLLTPQCKVITVTGTNGKGSTVTMLEAIYLQASYKVGAYLSPHLLVFNERIKLNGQPVSDLKLTQAFTLINKARGEIFLSYFEITTLSALWIFAQQKLDVIILEVGLGGRLDATNIIDTDLAIITSIGLDHIEQLGNSRDSVAREKAGIIRPGKPIICGDRSPPLTLIEIAKQLDSPLAICGVDYDYSCQAHAWQFKNHNTSLSSQQHPKLAINNIATVIQAVLTLQSQLPVTPAEIINSIVQVRLAGRFQVFSDTHQTIFDVAHNPHAAAHLATCLQSDRESNTYNGRIHAIFSMLADKDIKNTIAPLANLVDCWHIAALENSRAASLAELTQALNENNISQIEYYQNILTAYRHCIKQLKYGDTVLVYGSFLTVSPVLQYFIQSNKEEILV